MKKLIFGFFLLTSIFQLNANAGFNYTSNELTGTNQKKTLVFSSVSDKYFDGNVQLSINGYWYIIGVNAKGKQPCTGNPSSFALFLGMLSVNAQSQLKSKNRNS